MAASPPQNKFALDTNVLLDLAAENEAAWEVVERSHQRRVGLLVPPTVVQELAFAASKPGHRVQALSLVALSSLRSWGILPYDLKSVGHGLTDVFAQKLVDKGFLPEGELNDGYILAETALANIGWLVTSDAHLLSIRADDVAQQLMNAEMSTVFIISPKRFLFVLRNGGS